MEKFVNKNVIERGLTEQWNLGKNSGNWNFNLPPLNFYFYCFFINNFFENSQKQSTLFKKAVYWRYFVSTPKKSLSLSHTHTHNFSLLLHFKIFTIFEKWLNKKCNKNVPSHAPLPNFCSWSYPQKPKSTPSLVYISGVNLSGREGVEVVFDASTYDPINGIYFWKQFRGYGKNF